MADGRAPRCRGLGRSSGSRDAAPLLRRLLEFNAYDLSAIDGRDVGPDGTYGYDYLDLHWIEPDERVASCPRSHEAVIG
jgi:hypothetical protein